MVTTALLRHGRGPSDPVVAKALKYLEGFVQDDGGIHPPKSGVANYETASSTVVCFKEANKDGRYDAILKAAEKWLKKNQWNEGEQDRRRQPDR